MNIRPLFFVACLLYTCQGVVLGQGFTGYATATVSPEKITVQTYGFRDAAKTRAYDSLTIQPVGSVSKTTIGIAILKAVELGLISLDADINTYLPFPVQNPRLRSKSPITLRHLATHTSGIVDREKAYAEAYVEGTQSPESLEAFLRAYFLPDGKRYHKDNFMAAQPGEAYRYTNIGAALAAFVLESATKIPFDQFTRQYIFEPLGMHHTHWFYRDAFKDQYSQLFDEQGKALPPYTLTTFPDGAMKTTIADLSRYLQALAAGYRHQSPILADSSWDNLFEKQFTPAKAVRDIDPKEPNSGIFMAYVKSGMIGHSGSDPGVSAMIFFDPLTGKGKVFMGNHDLNAKNLDFFKKIWEGL